MRRVSAAKRKWNGLENINKLPHTSYTETKYKRHQPHINIHVKVAGSYTPYLYKHKVYAK